MVEPAAVAALSSATAPVERFGVAVPPAPRPVQFTDARALPAGTDSVIVVAVPAAASVRKEPETPIPGASVVIVWAAPKPLSPLNVNAPTLPMLIFVIVTAVGGTVAEAEALSLLSAERKSVMLAVLTMTAPLVAAAFTVCRKVKVWV